MISYIKGKISYIAENHIVLECAGIGYRIDMPLSSLGKIMEGEEVCVYTHMAVREDKICLYGFLTSSERAMFEMLLTVSGIGPKSALSILSSIDVDELKMAILSEDAKLISSARGIGSKTAQKIVLELKGKLDKDMPAFSDDPQAKTGNAGLVSGAKAQAVDVLEALGFSRASAVRAVNLVKDSDKMDSSSLVSEALKIIE